MAAQAVGRKEGTGTVPLSIIVCYLVTAVVATEAGAQCSNAHPLLLFG